MQVLEFNLYFCKKYVLRLNGYEESDKEVNGSFYVLHVCMFKLVQCKIEILLFTLH